MCQLQSALLPGLNRCDSKIFEKRATHRKKDHRKGILRKAAILLSHTNKIKAQNLAMDGIHLHLTNLASTPHHPQIIGSSRD